MNEPIGFRLSSLDPICFFHDWDELKKFKKLIERKMIYTIFARIFT